MNQETIRILNNIKATGLNAVGCHKKKYTHYTDYTIFLKEDKPNDDILKIVKESGFKLTHDFIQESIYGYRHGANKILNILE